MIQLDSVSVAYDDKVAVSDVSFRIGKNEIVSFLGASGCGKSTILNVIAGFIQPTSGYAFVSGKQITSPGPDRAVVFQSNALFNWLTVAGNITYSLKCRGAPASERASTARDMLQLVGLAGIGEKYPYQLSGGMRQRVGLARALAAKPDVILMDEPFAAVDVQTRETLQEEVLKIQDKTNSTIICITHSIDEAVFMGSRIFLFSSKEPGRHEEYVVDLPSPRWKPENRIHPNFLSLRNELYLKMRGDSAHETVLP
ncbi:MAG: ABC transporter ATP-binding protein [Bradyrhizobiaceae bacterium]|nr:MAG: ABC transporter ATP-binding protein [Bradyrhizobiaceae bacterium]